MAKDQSWIADILNGYKKIWTAVGGLLTPRNVLRVFGGAVVDNPNYADPSTGQIVGSTDLTVSGPLFVNVKDYGAVGDGVHDDTAAINEAVAYLSTVAGITATGGPTLFFPMGTYLTSTGVTLPKFCQLRGSAMGTSIQRTTVGNVITTAGAPEMYLHITDLDLLGYNYPSTTIPVWSAGLTPAVGAYYQLSVPSYILLQATTVTGPTGAHRPLGKLTWLQQPQAANVAPVSNWPDIVISGTPTSDVNLVIQIVAGGAPGTATFEYSTDAGATWSVVTTTGAAVAIGTTGLTADFTATAKGTYDAGSFAESPLGGFSLAVGSQIIDGGVTWTLVAGGTGISDTNGSLLNVERVNIYGCWVGVALDGTEEAWFRDVYIANAATQGLCGIWVCDAYGGSPHSSNLANSTNIISFDGFFVTGYRIPIIDDGGQGHVFRAFNTEGGNVSGMHYAGVSNGRFESGDFSDGFHSMTLGGGSYHLPTLPSVNSGGVAHGTGDFGQLAFCNVGFGPTAGQAVGNVVLSDTTSIRVIRLEDCLLGNASSAAFTGCANLGSFIDAGGNQLYNGNTATLCDSFSSKHGSVYGAGQSASTNYGGIGINVLPAGGLSVNGPVRASTTYVTFALSPYTVDTTAGVGDHDLHVDSTLGAVAINLPSASSSYDGVTGRELWLLDYAGTSGTNHITFTPASGTIGGAASLTFNTNGQKARIVASRGNNWVVYPL